MQQFLTRITFAKVLVVTVIGTVYIGMVADLPPNPATRTPDRQRTERTARTMRRMPAPYPVDQPVSRAISVTGARSDGVDAKPLTVWRGTLPKDHLAAEGPVGAVVTDLQTWQEVWSRFRGMEPPPSVDFSREVVVLGTVPGSNVAALKVWRDASGCSRVTIFGNSTPSTRGGYILVRVDRRKIDISLRNISKLRNAIGSGSDG